MRLDALPENQILQTAKSILAQVDQLKNRQIVGANSLVINYTTTTDEWDVDDTVFDSTAVAHWRVTFTPDTVSRPYAEIAFEWQVTPDTGFNGGTFDAYPDPANVSSNDVVFLVDMSNQNFDPVNVKLKFGFRSADTGAITVQRLADS